MQPSPQRQPRASLRIVAPCCILSDQDGQALPFKCLRAFVRLAVSIPDNQDIASIWRERHFLTYREPALLQPSRECGNPRFKRPDCKPCRRHSVHPTNFRVENIQAPNQENSSRPEGMIGAQTAVEILGTSPASYSLVREAYVAQNNAIPSNRNRVARFALRQDTSRPRFLAFHYSLPRA